MAAKRRPVTEMARREERTALWLLLPSFIVLILIAIYPLGQVFVTSFTNQQFASPAPTEFIGIENYRRLLSMTVRELPPVIDEETGQQALDRRGQPAYESPVQILPREPFRYRAVTQWDFGGRRYVLGATDAAFVQAIWDTLVFAVSSVFLETVLGLGVALVVNSRFPGRGLMRTAMLVPWAIITVVSARIWEWMFASSRVGLFNTLFEAIGIGDGNIAFLQLSQYQIPVMIAIDVWKTTPFMALLLLAGLASIPSELYEAAEVDGASKVRQFFAITLPLLRPILAVALVFRTLDALRVFDLFQVVFGSARYSMASYSYYQLIQARDAGMSSAISVLIFVLIFIFAITYIRLLGVRTQ
jgi:trehalose/maltose transport system permease protein